MWLIVIGMSLVFTAGSAARLFHVADTRNPAVDPAKSLKLQGAWGSLLARSCMDCHSDVTRWPWYSHVAGLESVIEGNVKIGRRRLNFSDWKSIIGDDAPEESRRKLSAICSEVRRGDMPPKTYMLAHPSAALTNSEISEICNWTRRQASRLAAFIPSTPDSQP
jgi:hypothetical protein